MTFKLPTQSSLSFVKPGRSVTQAELSILSRPISLRGNSKQITDYIQAHGLSLEAANQKVEVYAGEVAQEIVGYVQRRGVLTTEEAQIQIDTYFEKVPERAHIFTEVFAKAFAAKTSIADPFSYIGLRLATSKKTTVDEKLLAIDLYVAGKLEN